MSEVKPVTVERAREALEDLDDYARMDVGVDAKGPRETLERFIADHERVVAELRAENRRRLDDYDAMEALALEHKARASIAEARVAELEADARRTCGVVAYHAADLERCVPILREYGLSAVADECEKAVSELRTAIDQQLTAMQGGEA